MSKIYGIICVVIGLIGLAVGSLLPRAHAGADKVTICHKPNTPAETQMRVPDAAVDAHLGHGDWTGSCDRGGDKGR